MSEEGTKIESTNDTDTSTDRESGPDTSHDRHDHGERERSSGVREALKDAFREHGVDVSEGEDREDHRKRDEERERRQMERRGERPGRSAREAKAAASADAQQRDPQQTADAAAQSQSQSSAFGPDGSPKAWAAQARAEWQRLPKSVQDAIVKREKDTAAGVEAIKNRVAAEERAWQPYDATIRQFGMDRPATITRMMQWHEALSRDPIRSYPALAQSQGHDPKLIVASVIAANPQHFPQDVVNGALQGLGLRPAQPQAQQYQQGQQQTQQGYDPRFSQFEQRLAGIEQASYAQMQQNTMDTLMRWAADKPHFEHADRNGITVRHRMGQLLNPDPTTGRSIIPLKDGAVDLDAAYLMAVNMDDTLREQAYAERAAAERKAASDAAAKARRSSASLSPGAPGRGSGSSANAKQQKRSVRDSIMAAVDEARGGSKY